MSKAFEAKGSEGFQVSDGDRSWWVLPAWAYTLDAALKQFENDTGDRTNVHEGYMLFKGGEDPTEGEFVNAWWLGGESWKNKRGANKVYYQGEYIS